MPDYDDQRIDLARPRRARRTNRRRRRPAAADFIDEAAAPRFRLRRESAYRRFLVGADVLGALVPLLLVLLVREGEPARPAGVALAICALVVVNKLVGLYDRDELVLHRSTLDEVPRLGQIAGLFSLLVWLLHETVTEAFLSQADVLALWVGVFVLTVLGRLVGRAIVAHFTPAEPCLVVGDGELARRIADKMRDSHVRGFVAATIRMEDGIPPEEAFTALMQQHGIERVIVAQSGGNASQTLEVVRMAKAAGLRVSLLPRLHEIVGSSVVVDELDGLTMLGVQRFQFSRSSRAVKRSFDLVGVAIGLIAVAPLFGLLALAVRLGGGAGPIFFKQTRIGRDGKPFEIIKFRSMVADAEAQKDDLRDDNEADGLFKIAADPRITRVGGFLRATSLDELPQLLNVLRGEMSLVGPRPLVEEEDAMVRGFDRSRLHLTPGMTGPWQVLGSSRIPMKEMVAIDYLYVANWTLWGDVKILLRTVRHVFARSGM